MVFPGTSAPSMRLDRDFINFVTSGDETEGGGLKSPVRSMPAQLLAGFNRAVGESP